MDSPIGFQAWAAGVIERIDRGQRVEDWRVELKSSWPDGVKCARPLAEHSNAAHGAPILWLIEVDEEKGLVGAPAGEMSTWWSQLRSCLVGEPLMLVDATLDGHGKSIIALAFDTHLAPYLVKNARGGPPDHEVPFRRGTTTATASRTELLRILRVPLALPEIEVLESFLTLIPHEEKSVSVELQFLISPVTRDVVVFPSHKIMTSARLHGHSMSLFKEEPYTCGRVGARLPTGEWATTLRGSIS